MSRDERAHRLTRAVMSRLYVSPEPLSVSALILAFNGDPQNEGRRSEVLGILRALERQGLVRSADDGRTRVSWRSDQPSKRPAGLRDRSARSASDGVTR